MKSFHLKIANRNKRGSLTLGSAHTGSLDPNKLSMRRKLSRAGLGSELWSLNFG